MKCKGCKHCVLVSQVDEPYLHSSFHYCDRDIFSERGIGKLREEKVELKA